MTSFSIYGVNFFNKGAELMLYAVQKQIKQWDKGNVLAAQLRIGNFQQREKAGVKHLAWMSERERNTIKAPLIDFSARLIPKPIRQANNLLLESEVDVVLDASGFAFSDQWGAAKTETMAQLCARWKNQGKKVILLPQAFGPFENTRVREGFIKILENADLIFARDEISYEYINNLSVSMDNVKIAPDFTNLLNGKDTDYILDLAGRPCIVPNQRMLDKTASDSGSKYIDFLVANVESLLAKGYRPFILIHESRDIIIGQFLQSKISQPIPVIVEDDPLILKGILDKCYLVIGSRFHSLISSLSQGTPCLGTGWSHKYKMLFKNYNCLELLADTSNDISNHRSKLDLIIDESSRTEIINNIKLASERQKSLTKQMWVEVKNIL